MYQAMAELDAFAVIHRGKIPKKSSKGRLSLQACERDAVEHHTLIGPKYSWWRICQDRRLGKDTIEHLLPHT